MQVATSFSVSVAQFLLRASKSSLRSLRSAVFSLQCVPEEGSKGGREREREDGRQGNLGYGKQGDPQPEPCNKMR